MTRKRCLIPCALVAALLAAPEAANAVSQAGAIVDTFSPSARGMALAHAAGVVPEGPFALRWNPAGLALDQRSSFGATYNELAAGLADDVSITHFGGTFKHRAFGVGVYYARLSQGKFSPSGTYPSGSSESFESHEEAFRIGAAVDIFDLLSVETGRYHIDLTFGADAKKLSVDLAPASVTQDLGTGGGGGKASSWTMDAGALFRLGRFLDLGSTGGEAESYLGIRASIVSDCLKENDLVFEDADQEDPLPSRIRYGAALEANLFPIQSIGDLLQLVIAYEHQNSTVTGDESLYNSVGVEIALLNTIVLRGGSYEDARGDIVAGTYGVGLRLARPDLRWNVEIDYANRPQATRLPRVQMFTASVGYSFF